MNEGEPQAAASRYGGGQVRYLSGGNRTGVREPRRPASILRVPEAARRRRGSTPAPAVLIVSLAAPAVFAGTSASGSAADADVVTDAHGLPYLPRHRVAARLRDAAVSAVRADPALLPAARALFGASREHGPDRILRIGHALPPESVRAAVAWALEQRADDPTSAHGPTLLRAVTDAFTSLESGVEIDPGGAAVEGRLRTVRVLDPGLRLTAALRWARPPDTRELRCLARAALAFTQAGLKASRGRGRIDARLAETPETDRDNAHAATLTWAGIGTGGAVREEEV
ncbi:hypothetical protein ACFOVU_01015 [Nocardiopsis sediminis]|uniref:Uncharacterized protein n=1 Tax=Nocardiopsis sediminis TaxID=1778267 RepID=A0ABV8FGI6_9ACTN